MCPTSKICDVTLLEDRPTAIVVSGGVTRNEALRTRFGTMQNDLHIRR